MGQLKTIGTQEIQKKIYTIRGFQVMVDRDLAVIYGVETRVLNQAVKRNKERFPDKFCFQLDGKEFEDWISQFVISKKEKMGLRKAPFVFTEQGVAMLSGVLKSKTAIQTSIQIMNAFVSMRRFIMTNGQIFQRMDKIEKIQMLLDVEKCNAQYPAIEIREFKYAHDRFLIIDGNEVYHRGASLKDLGKKWFAFSRLDIKAVEMMAKLEGIVT